MQRMMPRFWALLWTLTFAVQVDTTLGRSHNHVKSICSMWGKGNYKTFDGDVYQFPGVCEYNLASDCHSSFQDFSVHVQKMVDDTGKITVSKVTVTIKDLPIYLTKQIIRVAGEIISTPYHVSGVLIEENSVYTNLHYKLGLSVQWNRDDAVMVELDSKYANRTCGLCGDYNGVPIYDEFIHHGRQIGSIEFGNKQRIHNPNVECEDPYEEDTEVKAGLQLHDSNLCAEARASCTRRLLSSAWASCASVLDPSPYIGACSLNLCQEPADSSSMCPTLAEYSRQCSHTRGFPPNWRTKKFCAMKCPYNMVYLESGSPCMTTCSHFQSNVLCEEHHIDGCFCPEGTVFDDLSKRGCIPKEQCQCKHDRIYDNGEVLKTDTEECSCHEGRWSCVSHARAGTCALEEGSHVSTYDGKTYNFHGNCFYVLSKDCVDSKFSILGELAPCSTQDWDTCLKKVVVRLMGDNTNDIFIQANGKVHHNADVNLPYSNGDVTIFQPSSFHIILQTRLGLQLQIQLVPIMQLYISLDQSFKNKTCGLCGNYNMVLSDDLRSTQGIVEGTAASFANSWKAQTSCADSRDRLDDPCSLSVDNDLFAEHWCSLLKTKESTFSKCHSAVNPEIYYKRCKYASCTCDKSEECLCAVVSSYVRACASKGIFLSSWRDTVCNKYTDRCPATQTFSYELKDCQRTCRSLSSDRQSCSLDFLPVDGCACPEGLYLDDSGMCIEMSKCPCLHNGDYIGPGKSITIKDEHCVCTNGKLHCRSGKTPSTGCPAPMVFFNCSAIDNSEAGMECVRTCMQLDVDCIPVECQSGCRCPSNLLDDGRGHCVEEHDCPCQHDGQFYASGSQIPVKCNNCTCNSGKWSCSNNVCSSTCSIYGSGHYQTFDDQRFGFSGECGYVAVQDSCGSTSGNFTVITENIPCGTTGTTCSKAVRIVLGRTELKLSDGRYVEVDLETGPKIKYTVRNVGLYLVIESDIGLTAFWDRRTTVRIILQPEHMGKVCGLCGNFNGDGKDDFTTQNELLVSDVLEFANSWKVTSTCPDAIDDFDPCYKNSNRHTWAKTHCSIIKGETFKNCHAKVDPTPYFDNCVKDSCACDNGGDCECFCTAVAAYAQACNEAGICVAWRTPDICPVYCDYYNGPAECTWHYSPCHTPCYKTCLNPDGICSDPLPNLEGCYPVCPPDKPIFDEGKQICVEECEGCFINGHEYQPGEEVPSDIPCTSCICNRYGNLTCNQIPGCCVYNGTEYEENDVIYNVTDNMGMCYYAICINGKVIQGNETCMSTPSPPTPTQTTEPPSSTFTTEKTTVLSSTSGKPSPSSPTSATPPPIETTSTTPIPGTSTPSQRPTQPTTVTTPEKTATTICVDVCEWTEWFNVDTPSVTEDDDETYDNIRKHGKEICEKPENIKCSAEGYENINFEDFVQETGQVVQCNVTFGLLCETHKQLLPPKKCFDYKIKAYCCKPCITTTGPPVSTPTPSSIPTPVETTAVTSTPGTTHPTAPTTTTGPLGPITTTAPETPLSSGPTTTTGPPISTTQTSAVTPASTTAKKETPTTPLSGTTTTTGPLVSTPTPGPTSASTPTPVETTAVTSTPGTTHPTAPTTTTGPLGPITTTAPETPLSSGPTTTTGPPISTTQTSAVTPASTTAKKETPTTPLSGTTTTTGPLVSTPTPGPTSASTPTPVETTAVMSTPGTTHPTAPTTTTEIIPVTGPIITISTKISTEPLHRVTTTQTSVVTPASTTAKKETPTTPLSGTTTTTGPLVSTPIPGPTSASTPTPVETTAVTSTPGTTHPTAPTTTTGPLGPITTTAPETPLSSGPTTTTGPPISTTQTSAVTPASTTAKKETPTTPLSGTTTTTGPLVSTPTPGPTSASTPTPVETTAVMSTPGTTHPTAPTTTTEIIPVTGPIITISTKISTEPLHRVTTTQTSVVTPASTTAKKETPTTPLSGTTTTTGPLVSTPIPGPTSASTPTPVETTAVTSTPGTTHPTAPTTTTGPLGPITTTAPETPLSSGPTTTTGPPISTRPSPSMTTTCVCIVNGTQYYPGDLIYDRHHIGSGICLTMICSDICEIQNSTGPCQTTSPAVSTTPSSPECPEWGKKHNEIFMLCNCTMARCIEDNIIEIVPYECPPLKNITCANGKKPVLVWDENHCCQKYACDCYCEGWGDPHYVTFDGLSYSHQGNCTYVLMEEIHPVFNFKIYVDNVKCDPREDVSCPRSIIISYKSDVITLKNKNIMGSVKLEVLYVQTSIKAQRDGTPLKLPYAKDGVRVLSSGLKLIYEIPQLQIVVTFGIVGFTVNLPYQHFGNNTQGHCGTCNNNPYDDCRLPDGRLVENCAVMADFWPAKHLYRPDCPVPNVVPTGTPIPLPTLRPCNEHSVCDLIKSDLFAECHAHISPDRFFSGCVFDSCHMSNPAVECTSLQTYAEACAQVGVCVYWRNHTTLCASDCPADKVYKACGPAEQPTCDSDPSEPGMNMVIEGCFCPEGTKLFSKESAVCVDKCGCLDPDGISREFNERFEYMCQDCVCVEDTRAVSCQVKQCPAPSVTFCTEPGFALVNTTDPANPCCPQLSCRCDISLCPTLRNKCGVGYEPVPTFTERKCCQDIICEPKNICLHQGAEYKPGESMPVKSCQECHCTTLKDPNSPFLQVDCKMVACKEECEAGYEYQNDYESCCGECIQTRCSLNISGTVSLIEPGSTWSPPDNKCVTYSCTKMGDKFIVTKSDIQCPPFNEANCQPGTTQTLSNGCCQVCEPIDKGCKVETVLKTITYQGCQSEDEVEMAYCEGTCNGYSKYSELEASMKRTCTCCRESRTSNRTVTLTCLDGSRMPHTYMQVEQCKCSNTLCDERYPWATKGRGRPKTKAKQRIKTGGENPIIKRSVLDRGG